MLHESKIHNDGAKLEQSLQVQAKMGEAKCYV